ncbi:septum formation initiator [Brumimicrobium salinarum]|uniref:Septum formation initiator n=1 Tax=Brumimicrobium salinarum TaxID=2058658 RepID=A0A2I0R3Z6_9FLAO|nr:septum formation initiator family protein [Brumimicrobium salinarum]PKR81314.1 septum formation initiator [Brumimicrobium salinarum]
MKQLKFLKNKYKVTFLIFLIYALFLDDVDVFNIVRQQIKLNQLKEERAILTERFKETKATLQQLDNTQALERFAREKKLFKRDNEDIFVIVRTEKQK